MRKDRSSMIAAEVVRRCEGANCITFEAGYALKPTGRVCFPPARTLSQTRNARGRCTNYAGVYADGSKIIFTYSAGSGRSTLRAIAPGAVI